VFNTKNKLKNARVSARLFEFDRKSLDNTADGNCFWYALSGQIGISVSNSKAHEGEQPSKMVSAISIDMKDTSLL
jgi:hypothetical protein